MDIFDSRYFFINNNFLTLVGLWPYDTKRKYFMRTIFFIANFFLTVPQIISMKNNYMDKERVMQHVVYILIVEGVFLKLFTLALAQDKLQIMFRGIADNWQIIMDEEEKKILNQYSENGRKITIVYMTFLAVGYTLFISLPIIPIVLDKISPQSEPRPYLYIMDGEYYLISDKDAHYFKIYLWDILTVASATLTAIATDSTYASCIQHCVGLFAIVRYRLKMPNRLIYDDSSEVTDDPYDWIVEIIKLHERIFKFVKSLEASYSTCFFMIISITVTAIPICSVMVLVNFNNPIGFIRFGVLFACLIIHTLFTCWLGQTLIDHSDILFQDVYCNEWYASSTRAKGLLRLVMLRCMNPCSISAGGLITINMENFYAITKKAVSYVTVCASFQ